jgi:hypothetical protein
LIPLTSWPGGCKTRPYGVDSVDIIAGGMALMGMALIVGAALAAARIEGNESHRPH